MISFHKTSKIKFPVTFQNEKHNVTIKTFRDDFQEFAFKLIIEKTRIVTEAYPLASQDSHDSDRNGNRSEVVSRNENKKASQNIKKSFANGASHTSGIMYGNLNGNLVGEEIEDASQSNSEVTSSNSRLSSATFALSKDRNHKEEDAEDEDQVIQRRHLRDDFILFMTEAQFEKLYKFSEHLKLKTVYVWLRDALLQKTSLREVNMILYSYEIELPFHSTKWQKTRKQSSFKRSSSPISTSHFRTMKRYSPFERSNSPMTRKSQQSSKLNRNQISTNHSNKANSESFKRSIPKRSHTASYVTRSQRQKSPFRSRSPMYGREVTNVGLEELPPNEEDEMQNIDTPREANFKKDIFVQSMTKSLPSIPSLKHVKKTLIPNHLTDSHSIATFFCKKSEAKYIQPVSVQLSRKVKAKQRCENDDLMVLRLIHSKLSNYSKMRSLWFVMYHEIKVEKVEIESFEEPTESVAIIESLPVELPPVPPPPVQSEISYRNPFSRMVYVGKKETESERKFTGTGIQRFFGESRNAVMSHFVSDESVYPQDREKLENELTARFRDRLILDQSPPSKSMQNDIQNVTLNFSNRSIPFSDSQSAVKIDHTNGTSQKLLPDISVNGALHHEYEGFGPVRRLRQIYTPSISGSIQVNSRKQLNQNLGQQGRKQRDPEHFGLVQRGNYTSSRAYHSKLTNENHWLIPMDDSLIVNDNSVPGLTEIRSEARSPYTTTICDFRLRDDFCGVWSVRLDYLCRRHEVYIGVCPNQPQIRESYCIAFDTSEQCFSISCKDSRVYYGGAPRGKIGEEISQGDTITFLYDGIEGRLYYFINGNRRRFAMRLRDTSNIRPAISFGQEKYMVSIIPPPPIESLS